MVNAINDLINLFSDWVESPGFAQGAAFVVVMMFLGSLFELPYGIMQLVWQRRVFHECNLRCEGQLSDSCHYKACPAHGTCPHYKPRERWSFFKALFQCKKDGAT